jgi:BirA family biotin operon repressor/biotin-[acetyl-CoA-carboxylase] ligase
MIPSAAAPLDARRIRAALAGHAIGADVEVHEELPSTSDYVRQLGEAGHLHGTVVFAESQSAGRGRRENKWSAEPRSALLFSVLLRPEVAPERFPRLATLTALGLCKALESACDLQPQIKWPNDLLLNGRKICGILTEMFTSAQGPFVVLGIGMNVNTTVFPPELRDIATSILLEKAMREIDRTMLAISLLRLLGTVLGSWEQGFDSVVAETERRSFLVGKTVRAVVNDEAVLGSVTGLDPEGCLLMHREDGSVLQLQSVEQIRAV